ATVVEQQLLGWLCRQAGLPASADGTMTPGGTLSNYMGLLLARETWCRERLGWPGRGKGVPSGARRWRILCSEKAHFRVEKAAVQLGLGTESVVRVAVDADYRLCVRDLDRQLALLAARRLIPMAIVATAGTTDVGAVDPLTDVAARARAVGAWLHVDAAYGGGPVVSAGHRRPRRGRGQGGSPQLPFSKP